MKGLLCVVFYTESACSILKSGVMIVDIWHLSESTYFYSKMGFLFDVWTGDCVFARGYIAARCQAVEEVMHTESFL